MDGPSGCSRRRRHGATTDAVARGIGEGTILIRTRGLAVGQLNGIALYNLAGTSFGLPVRITVRAYAGDDQAEATIDVTVAP